MSVVNSFEPVTWTLRERLFLAVIKRGTKAFNWEWRWWTKFTHQWEWGKVKGFRELPFWRRVKLRLRHRSLQPEIMWFVCKWVASWLETAKIREIVGGK